MAYGTVVAHGYCTACTTRPFANSLSVVPLIERAGYIGLTAFVVNVIVTVALTALFRALKVGNGTDITKESDYFADLGDPGVQPKVSAEKPIH